MKPVCGIAVTDQPDDGMVFVHGGEFQMGAGGIGSEELPVTKTKVDDFWISRHDVTNAQFARFVKETGYVTVAERSADPKARPDSTVKTVSSGGAVFQMPEEALSAGSLRWWHNEPEANWRHPEGPRSDITGLDSYPVVQVSFDDAQAYAQWAGLDLPSEAQWEYAARGGVEAQRYVWGSELNPGGRQMANIWQGQFPLHNSGADGFVRTSPVGCFPANRFGLYDMAGNVWQWTKDWYFPVHEEDQAVGDRNAELAARWGSPGYDPANPDVPSRVIKGGSFLCSPSYCASYRPAARQAHESDYGTDHIGFRTIRNSAKSPSQLSVSSILQPSGTKDAKEPIEP